jgi:predicted Zn finger-like uncharacterized protein
LQTRCPHCQTLFEIQQQQLDAASGQARCSCCDNIFNARKHLLSLEREEEESGSSGHPETDESGFSLNELFEEMTFPGDDFAELNRKLTAAQAVAADQEAAPRQVATDPPGDELAAERPFPEAHAPLLLDSQTDHELPSDEQSAPAAMAEALPAHLQPRDRRDGGQRNSHPLLWSLAILLMITLALGQFVWFSRGTLLQYPEVRKLAELACERLDCRLPPWHEPQSFQISERTVATHPESDQALQIRLTFRNAAGFAQAYPQLQLSLYDLNESLSARRRFQPGEYLGTPPGPRQLMPAGASVEVEMALRDPGREITAFIIDFL